MTELSTSHFRISLFWIGPIPEETYSASTQYDGEIEHLVYRWTSEDPKIIKLNEAISRVAETFDAFYQPENLWKPPLPSTRLTCDQTFKIPSGHSKLATSLQLYVGGVYDRDKFALFSRFYCARGLIWSPSAWKVLIVRFLPSGLLCRKMQWYVKINETTPQNPRYRSGVILVRGSAWTLKDHHHKSHYPR